MSATAASVLVIANLVLTATQVLGNAEAVLSKIRELEAKGATFEEILEALRGMVTASEADAKKLVG
jgi:hypothetical protein